MLPNLDSNPNVYEFDIQQFFPSVDLDYNMNRLKEIGVSDDISKYLRDLNKSIVKLTKEDLMDETLHRMALYNTDGSLNQNLDEAILKDLSHEDVLDEYSPKIQKYLKEGYTLKIEIGVPQGASTSCGMATLNLRDQYQRCPTIMYADDGLKFPLTNEIPLIDQPEAGVKIESSKSG